MKDDDATSKEDLATVTLGAEKMRNQPPRPVIHVLMSDGRVTEFRERAFAMTETPHPDQEQNDGRIYAVFVDSNGTPYVNDQGQVPMVAVPVVHLGAVHDPEEPLTWKQVAERAGVSLSTVKRAVEAGDIPRPLPVPGMDRAVRFKSDDVHAWLKGEIAKTKKRRR